MSKHTPGPWIVEGSSIMAQFEGQEIQIVAMMHTRWSYPDGGKTQRLHKESEANARLIAAAPDMLKVLESILNGFFWDATQQARSIIAELEAEDEMDGS